MKGTKPTKSSFEKNMQVSEKSGRPNRFSKFWKKLTKWLQKGKPEQKSNFPQNPSNKQKNEGNQTKTLFFWNKNMQSLKILGGQTVSPNFGNSWAFSFCWRVPRSSFHQKIGDSNVCCKMYDCQLQCKIWFDFRKYSESYSDLNEVEKAARNPWNMIWQWKTIQERKSDVRGGFKGHLVF